MLGCVTRVERVGRPRMSWEGAVLWDTYILERGGGRGEPGGLPISPPTLRGGPLL